MRARTIRPVLGASTDQHRSVEGFEHVTLRHRCAVRNQAMGGWNGGGVDSVE